MESTTLSTIQTVSKIGKILSTIAFACCLVGGICCILGTAFVGIPGTLKIGGITIHSMVESIEGIDLGTAYTAMVMGGIFCAAGCIVSKLAERYFAHELAAGTPFTFEGARELLRLGICTICVPFAAVIIADICYAVLSKYFADVANISVGGDVSILLGLAIIAASFICKYGAELASQANTTGSNAQPATQTYWTGNATQPVSQAN